MEKAQLYLNQLDKELAKFPQLAQLDKQLGHPQAKSFVVIAAAVLYVFLIIFNVAGELLTNLLGFVYPAYASFRAVESKGKDDDTQWLTYWVVFGFFNLIEFFSDHLLYWLPFYYLIKCGVIVYLALPQTNGAVVFYQSVLRPILLQNTTLIDSSYNKVKRTVQEAVADKSD